MSGVAVDGHAQQFELTRERQATASSNTANLGPRVLECMKAVTWHRAPERERRARCCFMRPLARVLGAALVSALLFFVEWLAVRFRRRFRALQDRYATKSIHFR